MFKFKRKPHLPPAQRLWKQFCEYEKDSAKESEFRCIAGICARQELLEAMCADIGLNAPNICAIGDGVETSMENESANDPMLFALESLSTLTDPVQCWSLIAWLIL